MLINKTLRHIVALYLVIFPLTVFAKGEKLCAIYPHLKDSYWLSVNYGMVSETRKQQATLKVFESGGYANLTKQQQQILDCQKWGADAILLGTVSTNGYQTTLSNFSAAIPVFTTVNLMTVSKQQSEHIKGVVGVDWYDMGFKVGQYLAQLHPKGSGRVTLALLPGPKSSGGTKPAIQGFRDSIVDSDIEIKTTLWADNDKELQRNLVQQVLDSETVPNYIAGSAVAIEAAISELRSLTIEPPKLLSIYLSHGVYRGLLRDKVLVAPTDQMVAQGRATVNQAVSYLRHKPYITPIEPEISVLTPNNLDRSSIDNSLSPSGYRPVFAVEVND